MAGGFPLSRRCGFMGELHTFSLYNFHGCQQSSSVEQECSNSACHTDKWCFWPQSACCTPIYTCISQLVTMAHLPGVSEVASVVHSSNWASFMSDSNRSTRSTGLTTVFSSVSWIRASAVSRQLELHPVAPACRMGFLVGAHFWNRKMTSADSVLSATILVQRFLCSLFYTGNPVLSIMHLACSLDLLLGVGGTFYRCIADTL